jgi:hypothetical protein
MISLINYDSSEIVQMIHHHSHDKFHGAAIHCDPIKGVY